MKIHSPHTSPHFYGAAPVVLYFVFFFYALFTPCTGNCTWVIWFYKPALWLFGELTGDNSWQMIAAQFMNLLLYYALGYVVGRLLLRARVIAPADATLPAPGGTFSGSDQA